MANDLARSIMGNIASKQGYERKGGAAVSRGHLSEQEERLLTEAIHRGKSPQGPVKRPAANTRRVSLEELGGVPAGKKAAGAPRGGAMMSLEELAGRGKRQEGGKE